MFDCLSVQLNIYFLWPILCWLAIFLNLFDCKRQTFGRCVAVNSFVKRCAHKIPFTLLAPLPKYINAATILCFFFFVNMWACSHHQQEMEVLCSWYSFQLKACLPNSFCLLVRTRGVYWRYFLILLVFFFIIISTFGEDTHWKSHTWMKL